MRANWRGRSRPARRPGPLEPLAGDGVDAAVGRGGEDFVATLAQDGDGLRADQAGTADHNDLHVDPPLSSDALGSWVACGNRQSSAPIHR